MSRHFKVIATAVVGVGVYCLKRQATARALKKKPAGEKKKEVTVSVSLADRVWLSVALVDNHADHCVPASCNWNLTVAASLSERSLFQHSVTRFFAFLRGCSDSHHITAHDLTAIACMPAMRAQW